MSALGHLAPLITKSGPEDLTQINAPPTSVGDDRPFRSPEGRAYSEVAQSDGRGTLPAFAPERLATTTQFFMDLVFKPMIMRALFGEKLNPLRAEIKAHVARSVAFFLAACRHGGVS